MLKEITGEIRYFDFDLNNEYFAKIDSPEVRKGQLTAKLAVQKKNNLYELRFAIEGHVRIPCDRCLDEMEQPIRYTDTIQVKFGPTYAEENETVVVPESEGSINIAWFIYEFIVLNIPMKHVHAPGECNKTVVNKLKKHLIRQKNDADETEFLEFEDDDESTDDKQIDPRWENLQNINFEN